MAPKVRNTGWRPASSLQASGSAPGELQSDLRGALGAGALGYLCARGGGKAMFVVAADNV